MVFPFFTDVAFAAPPDESTAVPLRYTTPRRAPSRPRVSAGGYRPVMPLWLSEAQASGKLDALCVEEARTPCVVRTGGGANGDLKVVTLSH
jgi:hypothetical protein